MKINCIIVDDEPLSQEILRDYVADCTDLNLRGVYSSAIEARNAIQQDKVDLILLDINMPKLSGINLIKSMYNPPLVVFVTAYQEFAVEGFDLDAVDYLLKPVSYERFLKAIDKVIVKLNHDELVENQLDHIMVKADKKMFRLAIEDILFAEAQGDYIKLYTGDRTYMVYETLGGFVDRLPESKFSRVHKSYLVSLSKIKYIEGNQLKIEETSIPVSPKYREFLMKKLNN